MAALVKPKAVKLKSPIIKQAVNDSAFDGGPVFFTHIYQDHLVENADSNIANKLLKCIITAIDENMDNPNFSVDDLSRHSCMSRSQFYRKMRENLQITPRMFMKKLKMFLAAHLLIRSDKKIADIAEICGYRDHSYFIKVFTGYYSMTPREYKMNLKR
jgi:AraC-like DNA-binding protein